MGSPGDLNGVGAVYVYRYNAAAMMWEQEQKLTASDGLDGDGFGYSVSISGDVVLSNSRDGPQNPGAAYVFSAGGDDCNQNFVLDACDIRSGNSGDCELGHGGARSRGSPVPIGQCD